MRIADSSFTIYYLSFTNPASQHGQQRIAIIRNDRTFVGSFLCTLAREEGKISIGRRQITIKQNGDTWIVPFSSNGPTKTRHMCGDDSRLEDSI